MLTVIKSRLSLWRRPWTYSNTVPNVNRTAYRKFSAQLQLSKSGRHQNKTVFKFLSKFCGIFIFFWITFSTSMMLMYQNVPGSQCCSLIKCGKVMLLVWATELLSSRMCSAPNGHARRKEASKLCLQNMPWIQIYWLCT